MGEVIYLEFYIIFQTQTLQECYKNHNNKESHMCNMARYLDYPPKQMYMKINNPNNGNKSPD